MDKPYDDGRARRLIPGRARLDLIAQRARDPGVRAANPIDLLDQLRTRARPGAPLYAYRVSASELVALRAQVAHDVQRRRFHDRAAARFCMYAAEQLRTGYTRGAWAWALVLDPIGWHPSDSELRAVVRTGLGYWQRPIVITGNQHRLLGTLLCEGGLPLNVLADDQERPAKTFFRTLIQLAERHQLSAAQFVEAQLSLLPSGLRNETVVDLAGRLADAIVALRARIPNTATGDPLDHLNAQGEAWQLEVPLRLDDHVLREFLRGLLAIRADRSYAASPLEVLTILHPQPSEHLERHARVQPRATLEAMAQLLGLEPAAQRSHVRFSLSLLTAQGERHPVAIARFNPDDDSYDLEYLPGSPVRQARTVTQRILLSATVGNQEIACTEPPGGEALLDDAPWSFEPGAHATARLRSQHDYRTNAERLIVLVPETAQLVSYEGNEPVRGAATVLERVVLEVAGSATWRVGEERWTVRTHSAAPPEARYVFSGALARAGFSGREYWRGLPRLDRIDPIGRRMRVPSEQIQVRARGTRDWRTWGALHGDLELRVREGSGTTYRAKLTVLPPDTRFTIRARDASITVHASGLQQARLATELVVPASDGACEVKLPSGSTATQVELDLLFRTGQCTLTVPAPVHRAQLLGRDGPIRAPIALDRIGQIRACAISLDTRDKFFLTARLRGKTEWKKLGEVPRAHPAADAWELSLDTIRPQLETLFAISDDLDEAVELKLESTNHEIEPSTIKLWRYEATLSAEWISEEDLELRLEPDAIESIGPAGLKLLTLYMRPLDQPDRVPIALERVSESRWRAHGPALSEARGWLFTGEINQRVRLRPIHFLSRSFAGSGRADSELARAMAETHRETRQASLTQLLTALAADWGRPEWDQLATFLATLGRLPARTFDVHLVMARLPRAAVSALFRCAADPQRFSQIWRGLEELPFLWSTVPISIWIEAGHTLAQWARQCGGGSDETTQLFLRTLTDLLVSKDPNHSYFLEVIHSLFAKIMPQCRPPTTPYLAPHCAPILATKLREHARELLSRHTGQWWPSGLAALASAPGGDEAGAITGRLLAELGAPHHQAVLQLPVLVGLLAGSNHTVPTSAIFAIRQIRTFDAAWFEVAHAIGFALAASCTQPGRA